ncbi:MAG: TonB-dependent receptor [Janthinobacterium lividum]
MVLHNGLRARSTGFGSAMRCGVSVTALCAMGLAMPALAQSTGQSASGSSVDPTAPVTGANQSSPTGAVAGPGTAGVATPTSQAESGTTDSTGPAAQNAGANGPNDVVVTGIRQSLANAQNIKRNSDTIVDAITSTDIGALPDRSVTEALQRVPGVEISRFAGANDPDHFSVEGSGVTVRGLNFVRSEFNGRDAFAAGIGGQALNFADVPTELLGSVEVYKNVTAASIEGGLAGTVNLNTRKPFDNKGLHIGADAEGSYGDFEKKWSPTGSLLVSDTWNTNVGTFGLLGDVSYSRVRSRADGIQVTNFQPRDNALVPYQNGNGVLVCRNALPGNADTTTLPASTAPCGTAPTAGADGFADPLSSAYAPQGGQYRTQDFDRKRDGIALAAQYETNDRSFLLTGQFIRSHTTNAWGEHTFEDASDLSQYNTYPNGCVQNSDGPLYNGNGTTRAECPVGKFTNYQYDANGVFQSGYITQPGSGYRTNRSGDPSGINMTAGVLDLPTSIPSGGSQTSNSERQVFEESTNNDYGVNAKINPSSRLSIDLDVDYTTSVHTESDVAIAGSTFVDQEVNLTGKLPSVISHKPSTLAAGWATPSPIANETDAQYFADPNTSFYRNAQEHYEDSRGREYQVAGNFEYKFGDDGAFLNKVKFGARYADRDQTVKYSAYNWGMLSEVWAGYPVTVAQEGAANSQFYTFPNFFRGQTAAPPGAYYYNGNLLGNPAGYQSFVNSVEALARQNGNTSQQFVTSSARPGAIAGTPYLPSEVSRLKEEDSEAYLMLPYQSDNFFGARISGNVGVRYVSTNTTSLSSSAVPTLQTLGIASQNNNAIAQPYDNVYAADGTTVVTAGRCALQSPPAGAPAGAPTRPGGVCNLGPAGYAQLVAFAATSATFVPTTARNDYSYFLPSFNFKISATDKLQFRLAASKVLTRPDTSLTRPFVSISIDGNGNFSTSAGNPYLKPATAWQFDATAEWYFSRVGSLTVDVFYKDVKNFFYSSLINSPVTNNGITFDQLIRGPANYNGDGKIKGAEVAYQQTFTFLPWLFSGLGASANYSYIDSSGLPNSFLNGGVAVTNVNPATQTGRLPLEGLSKHNANGTIFYEKGPVSIRAAYNWRSKYLLTAADVIYPYSSIYQAAGGQLDASAFINVNKYIKLGVQGVNLTNAVTETLQAYSNDPNQLAPRSYFVNDRRYSFILRGNF